MVKLINSSCCSITNSLPSHSIISHLIKNFFFQWMRISILLWDILMIRLRLIITLLSWSNTLIAIALSFFSKNLFVNNTCNETIEFKGLTKSQGGAYLDGTNEEEYPAYWYYGIGQIKGWSVHQIPGFLREQTPKIMEVNFWVKLNNLSLLKRFIKQPTCRGKIYYRPLFYS